MTWIYAMPGWVFMPLMTLVSCAAAVAGLALMRQRIARNDSITHNDVAGPILATIGTILAVMMSFMVVGVWQEYDGSAQNVQAEAGTLSDLHHLADSFPNPFRDRLKGKIDKYIVTVIHDEWPLMQRGGESIVAHTTAYDIERLVDIYKPQGGTQLTLQSAAIDLTQRFLDDRRRRIHDNQQGIPVILWATMLFTGAVTVLFAYYFRVERPAAQYIMIIALTSVIALTFSLMAELDYPFRGDVSISSQAFERAYQTIHNIDVGT